MSFNKVVNLELSLAKLLLGIEQNRLFSDIKCKSTSNAASSLGKCHFRRVPGKIDERFSIYI